jgi:hypothetical protein
MTSNGAGGGEAFKVGGHGNISVEPLQRNVQTLTIYVHELLNIKKDIKKGVPISWGLGLFWSFFCLCAGKIINAAMTESNFNAISYVLNLSPFLQIMLAVSFLGSLILFFIRESQDSALGGIDQILNQCGYDSKK